MRTAEPAHLIIFRDRRSAGAQLARALAPFGGQNALVLGIPPGGVIVADELARRLGAELDVVIPEESSAAREREDRLRGRRPALHIADRVVIVACDGLESDEPMRRVSLRLHDHGAAHVIAAVPTAGKDTALALAEAADELVCLATPESFRHVASCYEIDDAPGDEEIARVLALAEADRAMRDSAETYV